jgi:SRSO17 transposase
MTRPRTKGRALIDRELYLPVSWTTDPDRRAEAGINADVVFATTPTLAQRMLERLLAAGRRPAWFTADEAYGDNPGLRTWREAQDINYVMAISCDQRLSTPTGPTRVDELTARVPKRGWQRHCAGPGSKDQRLDDWLLIDPGAETHQLLVRRSLSKPDQLAYYTIHTPTPVALADLVQVAGSRWGGEETFQLAKNDTGLDHYQVRKHPAWYRHITLSMLAAAFLAVTAPTEHLLTEKRAPPSNPNT